MHGRRFGVAAVVAVGATLASSLSPVAWAAGELDQQSDAASGMGFSVVAGIHYAQTFTAGRTGSLDRIDLSMRSPISIPPETPILVAVVPVDDTGAPDSDEPLATGSATEAAVPQDAFGWVEVQLDEPVPVVEGQPYAVTVTTTLPHEQGFMIWESSTTNPYPGGHEWMMVSNDAEPAWIAQPHEDYGFRTYVDSAVDGDADGHDTTTDCDDADAAVHPDASETFNEVDDDCDGSVDEGFSRPGAPTIGRATSGAPGRPVTATARWFAPSVTGGTPVTAYHVQAMRLNRSGAVVGRVTRTVRPAARSVAVRLSQGRYRFRVAAVTEVGQGRWSSSSTIVRAR